MMFCSVNSARDQNDLPRFRMYMYRRKVSVRIVPINLGFNCWLTTKAGDARNPG